MNGTVTTLKVLVAIVLLATAPVALKRRWRLFLAIPLSVFQVFIPGMQVAGVPIPLAFWGGLMLWPELVTEFRILVGWKPTLYTLGIILLYTVSLLWSPDRKLGLQPIGYFAQFLIVFAAVVTEGRRDERLIVRLLIATAALSLLEALLVTVGRFSPGMKLSFLLTPVAKWVITPSIINNLFTGEFNGVMDPTKSGGMFVNANVAATFLGIVACTAFGLSLHLRRKWLGVLGGILLAAIVFTGSKAGLILAVAVPVVALHFISLRYRGWRNRIRMTMAGVVFLGIIGWLGPKAIHVGEASSYAELSSFAKKSDTSLSTRLKIWDYGAQAFMRHPFKGQGFGGWQQDFPRYARTVGLSPGLPPQNTIIYLWSQGGVLAALLGLALIYEVVVMGVRQLLNPQAPAFGLSLAMTAAFVWTFVRGMGSNFTLLGDVHMSPILAALLALGYLQRRPRRDADRSRAMNAAGELSGEPVSAYARRATALPP